MKSRLSIFLCLFILLLAACKHVKQLDEAESSEIADIINEQNPELTAAHGKSVPEKEWTKVFKKCLKNYTFQNPVYSGLSIQNGIGTVIDKKNRRILNFEPAFTHADSANIIEVGVKQDLCYMSSDKDFDFNIVLNPTISKIKIDSVKLGFSKAATKYITGGQWYEVQTAQVPMENYIKNQASGSSFLEALMRRDAVYVSSFICVSNFSADVKVDKDNELGLYMKKDSSGAKVELGGQFSITKISNDSFSIHCNNKFIPLVQFSKYGG